MRARDLIRFAVVHTNPYWPFSRLNRLPYALALESVKRRIGDLPFVSEIYLRHGLLRSDWEPGLSDIDLTIVVRGDEDVHRDYAAMQSLWRALDRLKSHYPMLGEIDVLDPDAMKVWIRFEVTGREASHWKPLLGTAALDVSHANDANASLDSLRHALSLYTSHLTRMLYERDSPFRVRAMARVARKIARYAGVAGTAFDGDAIDLVRQSLEALDRAVPPAPQTFRLPLPFVIEMTYLRPIVILDPAALESEIARFQRDRLPMLVTPSLFQFLLRDCDPFLHARLASAGRLPAGLDAPAASAFTRSIESQTPNVLLSARARALFSPGNKEFLSTRHFTIAVERATFLKVLHATGRVPDSFMALSEENQRLNGETLARAKAIGERGDSREAFDLLRALTREIVSAQ
jgi:predicted nucleotidyltransferase